jgi:hypothetical protein
MTIFDSHQQFAGDELFGFGAARLSEKFPRKARPDESDCSTAPIVVVPAPAGTQ